MKNSSQLYYLLGIFVYLTFFLFISCTDIIGGNVEDNQVLPPFTQPVFSHPHGLYEKKKIEVSILSDKRSDIRYTLDGSEPTEKSNLYINPLSVESTEIIRAAAFNDGKIVTPISTVSYLFIDSVLNQSNHPQGYPEYWGEYSLIEGVAIADYEMDQQMTKSDVLRPQLIEGLKSLPILSIVSDKENLFSHENDPDIGGIYVFTGSPYGDGTGRGWTRPVNFELFGGDKNYNLNVTCGLRIHGGAGRMAEYNPKHSFRLVFKEQYGAKRLNYPLFGEKEPSEFKQLVLRCHFDNAWQHIYDNYRKRAQYTRDVWVREMQKRMGHPCVNSLYVHLFINGLYWGIYNVAERVDDQFVKNHLKGKKADVIENEENGGLHMEASEGTLEGWNELIQIARKADEEANYEEIQKLLDINNFIDYMILNQYVGNLDWDHHNWLAIRSKEAEDNRFKLVCWDSESIMANVDDNVVSINHGDSVPSGIFNNLLRNKVFVMRYMERAEELLAEDGILGQNSVVQLWDSLYNTIKTALYDEAARWGDYRNKVHPYLTQGQKYTVDEHFMLERKRLLDLYFPYRSKVVLEQIRQFVSSLNANNIN